MSANQKIRYRTSLFWGGLRLHELNSEVEAGADIICIDIEDAVPLADKEKARNAVLDFLKKYSPSNASQYIVRINPIDTKDGRDDLEALVHSPGFLSYLMLPKIESVDAIKTVGQYLEDQNSSLNIFGIIETAKGLELASQIAVAHSRLKGFYFGGFDLSSAIGCEMDWEPLLYSRSKVVHAAALGEILAIDCPPALVDESTNQEKLISYCNRSRALGMMGMVTKLSSQVRAMNKAFTPSEEEVSRARAIVEMYELDPTKPIVYQGKLIELPMIKKLKQIL